MTDAALSLRERSKARRRRAIQLAAFELFAERGYEATTVRDIAERAEVAPRTISSYFPTKADIAVSRSADMAARLTERFESLPDADFVDVVDRWLTAEAETMDRELADAAAGMDQTAPRAAALGDQRLARAQEVGGPRLVAQIGLPLDDPMLKVVGDAVGAAISGYLAVVVRAGSSPALHTTFLDFLRTVMAAARPSGKPGEPAQ